MGLFSQFDPVDVARPCWTSECDILAVERQARVSAKPPITIEGYRGVVVPEEPPPPRDAPLYSLVMSTGERIVRRVGLQGEVARELWSREIDNPALCARFRRFVIAPERHGGLVVLDWFNGKTVLHETGGLSLYARPTATENGLVRCGLTDGRIVDVNLEALTITRHSPSQSGALRAGAPLPPASLHRRTTATIGGISYALRAKALTAAALRVTMIDGYDVIAPVIAFGVHLLVGLRRGSDLAIGLLDGETLQPIAVIAVGAAEPPEFERLYVVDDFIVVTAKLAREGTDWVSSSVIVDGRTRAIAARLFDHRSRTPSEVREPGGEITFRGRL